MTTKIHHGFSARIIADSVSPAGVRLTTAELIFPRFILSEFNTHRMLSKNSASSRAIPVTKQLEKIISSPYVPERIGVNQSGMQASKYLSGHKLELAQGNVYRKRDRAIIGALEDLMGHDFVAQKFGPVNFGRILVNGFNGAPDMAVFHSIMEDYAAKVAAAKQGEDDPEFLNIHKQTINRYLESFMWHTVVVTGTEWENLFALRIHEDAQDEIRIPIEMLRDAISGSTPKPLAMGEWHLPFVQEDEQEEARQNPGKWRWVSSGRCARTSYETHDGKRDADKDLFLAKERLLPHGHMSPFEHVATPMEDPNKFSGNFRGFTQFRKTIPGEANYGEKLSDFEN